MADKPNTLEDKLELLVCELLTVVHICRRENGNKNPPMEYIQDVAEKALAQVGRSVPSRLRLSTHGLVPDDDDGRDD